MNPADQYFERATEYHLVADRESDPGRRELMREVALCWLLQAEKAGEYWARQTSPRTLCRQGSLIRPVFITAARSARQDRQGRWDHRSMTSRPRDKRAIADTPSRPIEAIFGLCVETGARLETSCATKRIACSICNRGAPFGVTVHRSRPETTRYRKPWTIDAAEKEGGLDCRCYQSKPMHFHLVPNSGNPPVARLQRGSQTADDTRPRTATAAYPGAEAHVNFLLRCRD